VNRDIAANPLHFDAVCWAAPHDCRVRRLIRERGPYFRGVLVSTEAIPSILHPEGVKSGIA
jgi:hypothetical protein